MAGAGVTRFLVPTHKALRPIQYDPLGSDPTGTAAWAVHIRATEGRRGPQRLPARAIKNTNLEGSKIQTIVSGNSFDPTGNASFL